MELTTLPSSESSWLVMGRLYLYSLTLNTNFQVMQKNFMNCVGVFSALVAVVLAISVNHASSKGRTCYGSRNPLTIDSWILQLLACHCGEKCSCMSVALYCLSFKVVWGHVSWGFWHSTLKSQEAQGSLGGFLPVRHQHIQFLFGQTTTFLFFCYGPAPNLSCVNIPPFFMLSFNFTQLT
jgi:hypothetical protein